MSVTRPTRQARRYGAAAAADQCRYADFSRVSVWFGTDVRRSATPAFLGLRRRIRNGTGFARLRDGVVGGLWGTRDESRRRVVWHNGQHRSHRASLNGGRRLSSFSSRPNRGTEVGRLGHGLLPRLIDGREREMRRKM